MDEENFIATKLPADLNPNIKIDNCFIYATKSLKLQI